VLRWPVARAIEFGGKVFVKAVPQATRPFVPALRPKHFVAGAID
jgi:hypothetical protein